MSVMTAADEKRDQARNAIDVAINALSAILVDKCWGTEELSAEYKSELRRSFIALMEIKDKL